MNRGRGSLSGYSYTASNGSSVILGDYGFFKQDDQIFSSPDLAQNSLAYTNPEQAMANAEASISSMNAAYASVLAIRGGQAADAAVIEPTDALPWKWVAHGVLFAGTAYYIAKRDREIAGIRRRAGGPQGVQYSLRATSTGSYTCYLCFSGSMNLGAGDVWKYGETTKANRYRQSQLSGWGVRQVNEFYGNRVQIKVMEKMKIYGYFFRNGHLPPGNKIFR